MSRVVDQYRRACEYLAEAVSFPRPGSTGRSGHALLFDRAEAAVSGTLDGREYIDLCCSHGATLLGHGDRRVRRAVEQALDRGAPCSYENELHTEFAQLLCETIPCYERVRFTGSGSEATMHGLRLARAYTGRSKLLKFEGNFHGYHDQVMYAIGTPADRLGPEMPRLRIPALRGCRQDWISSWFWSLTTAPICWKKRSANMHGTRGGHLRADLLQRRLRPADPGVPVCPLPPSPATTASCCSLTRCSVPFAWVQVGRRSTSVSPPICVPSARRSAAASRSSTFGGRREIMDRLIAASATASIAALTTAIRQRWRPAWPP